MSRHRPSVVPCNAEHGPKFAAASVSVCSAASGRDYHCIGKFVCSTEPIGEASYSQLLRNQNIKQAGVCSYHTQTVFLVRMQPQRSREESLKPALAQCLAPLRHFIGFSAPLDESFRQRQVWAIIVWKPHG
ncbi:uncharacterized protein M421DRAFT_130312 [Didymella exigua CBS 183.55]|uniref:Uncharacterized protein n=1 Tax=Didymella exigua CBS 183.55 TaxID=1150837 RepID=A0A6A5RQV5_9PLEO|nr:uncharacterized protein M421DRAFT_130312 [Didymella exigua CBS 183.55]KAF1929823.1 hypothetical protein M421DRAFT_130312 [Didymella exigua CBS 183.55]